MQNDQYKVIRGFPSYGVSEAGEVVNLMRGGRAMGVNHNQYGHPYVVLSDPYTRLPRARHIGKLVAETYLEKPDEHFDTVIYLDYNKDNCHVTNLAWRPRWFAIDYNRQYKYDWGTTYPVRNVDTGEIFANIKDAAKAYGLLEAEIHAKVDTGRPVSPIDIIFETA